MLVFRRFALVALALAPTALAASGPQTQRRATKKSKKAKKKVAKKEESCSVGLVQVESTYSFDQTYSLLMNALRSSSNVFIAKEFDAVMVAGMANVTGLPPNRVVIFGNPALDGPLIQSDHAAALDLPQKMHVYETPEGKVFVGYNDPEYFEFRYDSIESSDQVLAANGMALRTLAASVTGVDPAEIHQNVIFGSSKKLFDKKYSAGVFEHRSKANFTTTVNRIVEAIPQNDLILVAEVDYRAVASTVGLKLHPTALIMLCFPQFDATFMQANQCSVADFPLKLLITEEITGVVKIRINNFQYLRGRHHIGPGAIDDDVYEHVKDTLVHIIKKASAE